MCSNVQIVPLSRAADWQGFLSKDECAEAERISNPLVKARFEIGRGLRRKMLSEASGVAADKLAFVEDGNGKPHVCNVEGWDFNTSHSEDYVAVAVGRGRLGIDIEKIRPVRDMESIAGRYFHSDEAAVWQDVPRSLRDEAFFVLWSAREAAMKCVGLGLARGLSSTRVDPAIVVGGAGSARTGGETVEVRRISAPEGYIAVLAQATR